MRWCQRWVSYLSTHWLPCPLPLVPVSPRNKGWIWGRLQWEWKEKGKLEFGDLTPRFWYKWHTLIIVTTPSVNSQICYCAYSSHALAFISVTTLEITVPQPGFSGSSFLSHLHVSFSQKTSLSCPGCSRNMAKSCRCLNTAVLGWGKKGEFRLNLGKGKNNLWFWSKHPSSG